MTLETCEWCKRSVFPNELRYCKVMDCRVCRTCGVDDSRKTFGEMQEELRARARATAFQNGMGWVK